MLCYNVTNIQMIGGIQMTLIRCPEWGKEVLDKAKACPNCGYPIENIDIPEIKSENEPTPETKYFTVCYKCGDFAFTAKTRIDNTTQAQGYPTCVSCGGKLKILAGKNEWMKKSKREPEDIVEQEEQAIRSGPDFDIRSATWSKGIRADLDVLGYCPKCASY